MGIFNSNHSHVWGEANPDTAFWSMFGWALCMIFDWVLLVTPSWLNALGVYGGNATRIAGGNPLGIQEKHVVPA
jgi:hypothetical protein